MDKIRPVPVVEVGASNNRAYVNELCMSVGNVSSKDYPAPKTSGIKTRGNGAASKGTTARGPMA
jgi:hypothetical protein